MSGFEALPAREGGRHAKRRRGAPSSAAPAAAAAAAAAAHSYAVLTEPEDVAAQPPPIYDSAHFSSAQRQAINEPGGVEGSGGMGKWEYLDHTADVQVHTWGESLAEAFAQQALGMWAYMTDLRTVEVDASCTRVVEAHGVDPISLLFAWLDGCLCCYGQDYFVGREVAVTHGGREGEGGSWCIRAIVRGEKFVFGKHEQGTEVKAITYSNMQIFAADGTVYSANDAGDAAAAAAAVAAAGGAAGAAASAAGVGGVVGAPEAGSGSGASAGGGAGSPAAAAVAATAASGSGAVRGARRGPVDVYCIVDI